MDLTKLNRVIELDNEAGVVIVEPGINLAELEDFLRIKGWSLRISSEWKNATIGGLLSSCYYGLGSISFGGLSSIGNVLKMNVVTMEKNPRILSITNPTSIAGMINSGGTCGVISEISLALTPAQNWSRLLVTFDTFERAIRFCNHLTFEDGVIKRNMSLLQNPLGLVFGVPIPEGHHVVSLITTISSLSPLEYFIKQHNGFLIKINNQFDDRHHFCLAWAALNKQCAALFKPHWCSLEYHLPMSHWNKPLNRQSSSSEQTTVETELLKLSENDMKSHLEFVRGINGQPTMICHPLFPYLSEQHIQHVAERISLNSSFTENPHQLTIRPLPDYAVVQRSLKKDHDPNLLMNPGKFMQEMSIWSD